MRTALGVSAGSEVVCSALLTTAQNGAQSTEYRVITTDDQANTDLGDLVASSIELMTTQVSREAVHPKGIAVAYRTKEQTQSIRSAVGSQRRDLQLVPESAAALAYLRNTGEVAQYGTIALVDLGARGLTVTTIDQVDGTVLDSERTTDVSGNAMDELVYEHLLAEHYAGERGVRTNRGQLTGRARAAKEHLSTNDAVTIDHVAGRPLQLTREDFEALIAGVVDEAVIFTTGIFDRTPERRPETVAVIGGGANIPFVKNRLQGALDIPVLGPREPEAVIAKGAALLADSAGPLSYPVVSLAAEAPVGTFTKVAGALIGAFVVVGLIVGYGVQALTPSDNDRVDPAGTSNQQATNSLVTNAPTTTQAPVAPHPQTASGFPTYEYPAAEPTQTGLPSELGPWPTVTNPAPVGTTTTAPGTTTTTRTPAPTLRPDPNLPPVQWPELEKWLPFTTTPPPTTTPDTTEQLSPSQPPSSSTDQNSSSSAPSTDTRTETSDPSAQSQPRSQSPEAAVPTNGQLPNTGSSGNN
ncbi:Hsp70 family protein [Antrihabitans cavernicola]|uniref:Hsp70 family protein n=1 Tax=Antrihabitans cavernicola TaxID=2495913 RepID=A0A5A7SB41_9NOCA|nr:Hsp70 family protein [Spelaeibacter cavernicola]KAA0022744.1 Hsp70 family protein [Spelaeibacter cavernicola]